jgi:hypothetical protein
MSNAPVPQLLSALFELATLQLRLTISMSEAMWTLSSPSGLIEAKKDLEVSDVGIDAAARVIEARLLDQHELGFQSLLRTNFPRGILREIARAALVAARDAETTKA